MTQPELSDALADILQHPVGRQRINDWEAGNRLPPSTSLVALADLVAAGVGIGRDEAMAFMVREIGTRQAQPASAPAAATETPRKQSRRSAG